MHSGNFATIIGFLFEPLAFVLSQEFPQFYAQRSIANFMVTLICSRCITSNINIRQAPCMFVQSYKMSNEIHIKFFPAV